MTPEKIVDIATVSGSRGTRNSVNKQLREYLPPEGALESYSFEEGIPKKIYAKVLLLTGESFERRLENMDAIWPESHIVIAKRTVNVECINMLVSIGSQRTVLVVNDTIASAMDAIESLQSIGFSGWRCIPYSPELSPEELPKEIDCVISVGEPDLVPPGFDPVYDMGTRGVSAETIAEVWNLLGWSMEAVERYINKYLEQIISMTQRAYDSAVRVDEANRNLVSVIDSVDDGMMVYDRHTERIAVFNNHLRKLSGIVEEVAGKKISAAIKEPQIVQLLQTPAGEHEEQLVEWNGRTMMATRFSLDEGREVCTFRSVDTIRKESSKLARELVQQGFYSKYTFDDILGTSEQIQEAKSRALRLARTDLNILIEGESGTGKELFAAAIHRASSRSDKPYLAINFSSLNDSLMESELFGYEEGAFTGARRGGKAGVFEMAHGGTIFLDEIGDISLKMQVGLLRVLQEKEVMRIGDGKIRYVDVRVIAATNQNLLEKVRQGLFREDLYYRLKIGYVYVPPLRSRRQDIPYLATMLLKQQGGDHVTMTPQLLQWMEKQSWPGNVRELKNTIIYMDALRNGDVIDVKDIPERQGFREAEMGPPVQPGEETVQSGEETVQPGEETVQSSGDSQLLGLIGQLLNTGILLGRRQLLEEAKARGLCTSEYQLRKRLTELERDGNIIMGKGKVGIRLP
ncbi:MAG: sigma 54-interacting transcriptional regulator [Firmicutes bacterium]|nr:sigma 54-interacting transcriptional regulator [Bacillota bacterium]